MLPKTFLAIKLSFSLVDICPSATLLTRKALLVLEISELLSNLNRRVSMVLNNINNESKVFYMRF